MRNPDRIDKFCDELKTIWHQVPDWRFGQLMSNVLSAFQAEKMRDIFYPEDEEMLAFFKEYFKEIKMIKVGDKLRIIIMQGEPQYTGKEGTVEYIDDAGGIHGSWGGLALLEGDVWELIDNN